MKRYVYLSPPPNITLMCCYFRYTPRDACMNSETYHYKRGANQQFCQVSHIFDPSQYLEEELTYTPDRDLIPIAIHCVAEEGEGNEYIENEHAF